jgi:hypothetical protein
MASMKKSKKCTKCEKEKPAPEFYMGYNTCKECHKAAVTASRNKHYKKFKRYQKRYYYSNPDKVEQWTKNYRQRYEIEHGISYNEHQYQLVKERMKTEPELVERKKQDGKRYRDRDRKSINFKKRKEYAQDKSWHKQYYQENKERILEYQRQRRARKKALDQIEITQSNYN